MIYETGILVSKEMKKKKKIGFKIANLICVNFSNRNS
jgi:hypothetical protein